MRGWVAISVTATPAASPRRIREVLRMIIGEPSGLRLHGPGSTGTPSLRNSTYSTGWLAPPALATADWAPPPITATGSPRFHEMPHRVTHDYAAGTGTKDQESTIIMSMIC